MNVAKKRAKAHAMLRAEKGGDEPIVTEEKYLNQISSALKWYTDNQEKKLRKYAIEYFAKKAKKAEVIAIDKATDFEVRQLGILCRLHSREQYLSEVHVTLINSMAAALIEKYKNPPKKKVEKEVVAAPVVSIQDRMDEQARKHAAEFDGALDDFTINKTTEFSAKNYLLANSVSAPVAKRIGDFYAGTLAELQEAYEGDDKQLVEGYSNFTRRELKKFIGFVEQIIADCQQQVQTAKATRAPRKRKPVSPAKLTAKVKYLKEFAELGLKSVEPAKIVESSEVWVYNTKYRRIGVYKADGGVLSVKGTTIIGFSVSESKQMTLRKPEEFFKGLSIGKRALNSALKSLTTKPAVPNGRINEETIILGAF